MYMQALRVPVHVPRPCVPRALPGSLQVSAIDTCLREEPGRFKCSKVQGDFGEEPSSGSFGKAVFAQ